MLSLKSLPNGTLLNYQGRKAIKARDTDDGTYIIIFTKLKGYSSESNFVELGKEDVQITIGTFLSTFNNFSEILKNEKTINDKEITGFKVWYLCSGGCTYCIDLNGKNCTEEEANVTISVKLLPPTTFVYENKDAKGLLQFELLKTLSLNRPTYTGVTGDTVQLQAYPSPSYVYTKIAWSSSDNTIATVDENGLVKFLKSGSVKITATSVD